MEYPTRSEDGKIRQRKIVFSLVGVASFITWNILPYSRQFPLFLVAFIPFLLLLLWISYEIYQDRLKRGVVRDTFIGYVIKRRVLYQNAILAFLMSSFSLILVLIGTAISIIGAYIVILILDAIFGSLALFFFFKRPGVKRIMAKSQPVVNSLSSLIYGLASKNDLTVPEFRLLAPRPNAVPNAFSWSIPFTPGFIFANEELFSVLDDQEALGIISHELGHIKLKHSEKSYLISSFLPLIWIDLLIADVFLVGWPFYPIGVAALLLFAAFYITIGRGIVSRRFERQADIFAGMNVDKATYINALRKLSQNTPYSKGNRRSFSHDSLEDRENLIRSL